MSAPEAEAVSNEPKRAQVRFDRFSIFDIGRDHRLNAHERWLLQVLCHVADETQFQRPSTGWKAPGSHALSAHLVRTGSERSRSSFGTNSSLGLLAVESPKGPRMPREEQSLESRTIRGLIAD